MVQVKITLASKASHIMCGAFGASVFAAAMVLFFVWWPPTVLLSTLA
jgi:hypothetical protein